MTVALFKTLMSESGFFGEVSTVTRIGHVRDAILVTDDGFGAVGGITLGGGGVGEPRTGIMYMRVGVLRVGVCACVYVCVCA